MDNTHARRDFAGRAANHGSLVGLKMLHWVRSEPISFSAVLRQDVEDLDSNVAQVLVFFRRHLQSATPAEPIERKVQLFDKLPCGTSTISTN